VQDVIEHLQPGRKPAYTTVLTTLQNLTKSGWVNPEKSGRAYVYHATKSRQQAGAKSIAAFVRRAFDGNTRAMFQTLLEQQELTPKELDELRKMIDAKRREKKQ
ncbi:MAG: BlaI/MecI/CopY family transcriptional regulator, partial [Pirellulaceae bacterium]